MTTLTDFVNREFELSGVDTGSTTAGAWGTEAANTLTFVLDGVAYQALEDPSDGYRSSMKEIARLPGTTEIKNTFTPCLVRGEWMELGDRIKFVSAATEKLILEIGTDNSDDYYPSFVANFQPENMDVNSFDPTKARGEDESSLMELVKAKAKAKHDQEYTARIEEERNKAGWGSF